MEAIGLLGMLGITTYEDIHRKEVHSIILLAFAILGMAFHLIFHKLGIYDMYDLCQFPIEILYKERMRL